MIAEEVVEVDPRLCFRQKDKTTGEEILQGVQYDRIVPLLLMETRKLMEELKALRVQLQSKVDV